MVGNDIVDLRVARYSTDWKRPRWLQKIFVPSEQVLIEASSDPFTTVWKLWSIKESAYKVFIQAGGQPFYNPTQIICQLETSTQSGVQIGSLWLNAKTLETPAYVFSTAQFQDNAIQTQLLQFVSKQPQEQSQTIKQRLLHDVATQKSLAPTTLQLRKTNTGIPKIYHEQRLLPLSISITHHGGYGAYSVVVEE